MPAVSMTVNGTEVSADIDPRTLLVQFLRETLRLTGTHVGCDTSQCGAHPPGIVRVPDQRSSPVEHNSTDRHASYLGAAVR